MVEMPGVRWGGKAARRLAGLGSVRIGPGPTGEELARVEEQFGFEFADDHRSFLAAGLPAGGGWPDWRYGDPDGLRQWLALPRKGVLEAVRSKGYWASSWGVRPDGVTDAEAAAADHLAAAPWLVPIFGRRYLPAGRGTYGHPVLSVYGADVICWAPALVDYVLQEFGEGGVGRRYSYEGWEMSASAEFWAEYLAWPALEPKFARIWHAPAPRRPHTYRHERASRQIRMPSVPRRLLVSLVGYLQQRPDRKIRRSSDRVGRES